MFVRIDCGCCSFCQLEGLVNKPQNDCCQEYCSVLAATRSQIPIVLSSYNNMQNIMETMNITYRQAGGRGNRGQGRAEEVEGGEEEQRQDSHGRLRWL